MRRNHKIRSSTVAALFAIGFVAALSSIARGAIRRAPAQDAPAATSAAPSQATTPADNATLRGRVVRSNGAGVADVLIFVTVILEGRARFHRSDDEMPEMWQATTQRDGSWEITAPVAGRKIGIDARFTPRTCGEPPKDPKDMTPAERAAERYGIVATGAHEQPDFPSHIGVLRPRAGVTESLDFAVREWCRIAGRVSDSAGRPLRGARIDATDIGTGFITDDDGRVEARLLPGGSTRILVAHPDGARQVLGPFELNEGKTVTFAAKLARGGGLRGKLVMDRGGVYWHSQYGPILSVSTPNERSPSASLAVQFREGDPMQDLWWPTPERDGSFLIEHLPAGVVDFSASAYLLDDAAGERDEFQPDRLCRETPTELLERIDPEQRRAFPSIKYPVPLQAFARGIEIREGQITDIGEVHYELPGRVSGVVRGSDGRLAADAPVYLSLTRFEQVQFEDVNGEGFMLDTIMTRTDANGHFSFDNICRGERSIWAGAFDAPRDARVSLNVEPTSEIRIELKAARPRVPQ